MRYFGKRLREPSTWAGLAAFLTAVGVSSEVSHQIITIGAGIAALAAIFTPSPNGSEDGPQ